MRIIVVRIGMRAASFLFFLLENTMPAIKDIKAFDAEFDQAIETLKNSERITKDTLRIYANLAIDATHQTGQCAYLNKLSAVLTPMNKKVWMLFAKHFAGFHYNTDELLFDKKSKKRYAQASKDWTAFREDPNNNLWTWADRHVQIEQKPYNIEKLGKALSSAWKAAHAANISNADIIKAMLSVNDKESHSVFSMDDVAEALQSMGIEGDLAVEEDSILKPKEQQPIAQDAMI
jgi:hypothetical protein